MTTVNTTMTDKPITLPPLPEPYFGEPKSLHDTHLGPCFIASDLEAYARAAVLADRALNATAQGMVPDLDGKSTAAYRQYIEAMQRTECLGWEHKVKTGRFGEAELKAHCKAAEYLGMHRAYSDAVNLLAAAPTAAIPAVDAVAGEPVAEPRKRIRLNVSREWLQEKLAQGDDSECGAGFELMPEARAASEGESLKLALEQERQKFQQETRRTSELMVLLRRWVERHVAEHGPGPWARSCDVCALVGESQELLARPINATPPRAGSETTASASELEAALVAECERAMAQRDEFKRTGISTASHGGSHDTCFGQILRDHGVVTSSTASASVQGVDKLTDDLDELASELHYEGNQEMSQEKQDRAALIYRGVEALLRNASKSVQGVMGAEVVTNEMMNRFLGWKLPADFSPDGGITFKRIYNETSPFGPRIAEPTGTNLFTADQARAMLEYVIGATPAAPSQGAGTGEKR
jgi:hypothetical protein